MADVRLAVGGALWVPLVAASVGCGGASGAFACDDSVDCDTAVDGRCEASGWCSYPDLECEGGRRYSAAAGDLAGVCLGLEPSGERDADGGPPDTSGDDSGVTADAGAVATPDAGGVEPIELTVTAEADAYVRDGEFAGQNFGRGSVVEVKLDGNPGYTRQGFLRFDLSALPPGRVITAAITLTVRQADAPATHQMALVEDDSWSELGITFATRPAAGQVLGSWEVSADPRPTIIVTAAAESARAGDGELSVRVRSLTEGVGDAQNYATYHARESAFPAVLVVTMRPE